jgi:hypothetical protein
MEDVKKLTLIGKVDSGLRVIACEPHHLEENV